MRLIIALERGKIMLHKTNLESLPHDYSVLLNVNPSSEFEMYKIFESIKNPSVLVSLVRPASNIRDILKRHKIRPRDIHIIDAISHEINAEKIENATYLHSSRNLSDLSVAIDNQLRSSSAEKKTLVFDSIAKLSQFHDADALVGFVKFLNARLKDCNAQGIFISSGKINHINNKVMHLMDKVYNF